MIRGARRDNGFWAMGMQANVFLTLKSACSPKKLIAVARVGDGAVFGDVGDGAGWYSFPTQLPPDID